MVKKIRDDRSIAFNADLGPEGPLYELRNLVASQDDLELCYRGNSQNFPARQIDIYYKSHVMFEIVKYKSPKANTGKYKLSFDFNHARYKDNWEEDYKNLADNFFFSKLISNKKKTGFNRISVCFDSYKKEQWETLYKIIKPIIDNFFDYDGNKDDYIQSFLNDGCKVIGTRRNLLEKIRQQQIFSENQYCMDGYFMYDLEFSISHENKNTRNKDENNNEPDMLAVKFEKGIPTKLVFVELKSRDETCEKGSGVEKHLTCMFGWLEDYEFLKARKDEAQKIIAHYAEIGLRGLEPTRKVDDFSNIDIEILLIFTDTAIKWAEDNRKNIESWAGKYLDKLVITKSDESGKISSLENPQAKN